MSLPELDVSGQQWKCGCLPRVCGLGAQFPLLADRIELIPESDWREVDWSHFVPEIMNQDGIGSCFPAGTLIRMGDGSQKPIEDVRVLDEVLTAEGRVRKVLKTMVRREGAGLVRLKTWGHRHLLATKEHPILTDTGYVPIGELKAGDMIAMPRFMPQAAAVVMPDEYLSQRDDDYRSTLTDTHVFRKVTATESEPFSGYVYNLEVEDDHSYVAEGIGVHNCNAHAATTALRICRIMAGQPDVRLSPGHLYGRINGGRDQGSLLGDALEALMKEGVCTTDEVGELVWRKRDWPSGLEAISARYKITEAFDAPTFSHLATAILMGFVVDYGIMVGNAFDTDASGWVAEGGGRGGHAMCGVGLARREKRGKTQWGIVTVNSWGKQWGRDGLGIVPSSYFANETFTDGWAVRVAVDPSEEAYPA